MAKSQNNNAINLEENQTSKSKIDKTKGFGKQIPNLRKFNEDKDKNGESYLINSIREIVSHKTKQFYMIIETEEFTAICHRGNIKSKHLLEKLLPNLEGKEGKRLTATVNSSAKDGFDLGYDSHETSLYVKSTEEKETEEGIVELVTYTLKDPNEEPEDSENFEEKKLGELTAEAILDTSATK